MNEQQTTLLEMTLNKQVDRQLDQIVQAAVRTAKLLEGGAMRENQLRNVLDTALHTESLELVANFIRYQIGRSTDWQRNNFGEELIAVFVKDGLIDRLAKQVATQTKENAEIKASETAIRERASMMLTRRFLGEMNRAFLYADRTRNWQGLKPILET